MNLLGPTKTLPASASLRIRAAGPDDVDALARLAALDSSRVPTGTILIAEVGDEPWAAISVEDFHAVADPFRPTGELVLVLIERAGQLRRARRSRTDGHSWARRRRWSGPHAV